MMTVSRTPYLLKAKWSCLRTAILSPGVMMTSPLSASISPERIFMKVDLPAPLAPMMP